MLLAQQGPTIQIHDVAEFNAYQNAIGQSDPTAKAAALENFLQFYPQSVAKSSVLDMLIDTYNNLRDADKELSAASRLLQEEPNNLKAILYSVFIKKGQCGKSGDAQTCDDAAALARKGLFAPQPADVSDADWKKQTGGSYPIFHSAIAFDDAISKKDYQAAIAEYTAELMLYTDTQTQSGPGLQDTINLAKAYSQPGAQDLVKAVWFYARAWDFVPAGYKPIIEKSLEYYYMKYHGDLNGLDNIKSQAALTTFPPGTQKIEASATQTEQNRDLIPNTPGPANVAPPSGVRFGFQVRPVIQDDMAPLALVSTKGLVVVSIENGSLADIMGMLAGDVILQVNGADVGDMQHFSQLIHSGAVTTFNVWRKGKTLLLTVPQSM
jgi:hypothetical protein